jgi:murein L,D-transpeptidase YcbB/YkuD
MIRAIVAAQVNEQFSARRKELLSGQEEQPFWKSSRNVFMDPKTLAALRDLGKEQTALMKSLLGSDGVPGNEEMNAWQRRQFGNLPAEKLTQLQSINSDYAELQQEIYAKSKGVILAEDREKLAFLEKEKLADIAKTLTPQELEDFQLRTSNTANQLRNQLTTFNATEAEFRALYKAASGVDEKFGRNIGFSNPNDYQARQAALLAAAQTALSPERFAEYKQAADPQYQQINRLVARLELPAATSQQVVALQQDIQTRARAIQTNRDLPAADRTTQLEALQAAGEALIMQIRGREANTRKRRNCSRS